MSIECFEAEPDDTGTSMVEEAKPLAKVSSIAFLIH